MILREEHFKRHKIATLFELIYIHLFFRNSKVLEKKMQRLVFIFAMILFLEFTQGFFKVFLCSKSLSPEIIPIEKKLPRIFL